jgi:hypothetical protein
MECGPRQIQRRRELKSLLALTSLAVGLVGCIERVPLENHVPLPPNFPKITRFVASPRIIHRGEKVLLQWNVRNVSEVSLERAIDPRADIRAEFDSLGTFPANGNFEVHPSESTTYIISCGNKRIGCSEASVHVIVK